MPDPRSNRRIVLAQRPKGSATLACFALDSVPLPQPAEGEVLVKTQWLSLDPYMRGRMSEGPSYAAPVALGAVMTGQGVAKVEVSRSSQFAVGDLVLAPVGWQEYAALPAKLLTRLRALDQPSAALGVLGMPAFTAYVGLLDLGAPRAGETVVVGAATGAVGAVVAQIGKIKGCRVVGIAGGRAKCDWAVKELGIDACIDHRGADFPAALRAACPGGIDVYFESVGGELFRAVLPLLNDHARMPVCGLISHYDAPPQAASESASRSEGIASLMRTILIKRLSVRGFIISDHGDRFEEFFTHMQGWLKEGRIRYREHVIEGLENAPQAFLGLLSGGNFGKLVVHIADG